MTCNLKCVDYPLFITFPKKLWIFCGTNLRKIKLTSRWLRRVSQPRPNQTTGPRHSDYKLCRWVNSYGSFHSVLEGHQRWHCTWSSLLWLLNLSLRLSATIKLQWDKTLAKKSECHNKAVCVAVQQSTLSELCGAPVSCFLNDLMVTVTIDFYYFYNKFCFILLNRMCLFEHLVSSVVPSHPLVQPH